LKALDTVLEEDRTELCGPRYSRRNGAGEASAPVRWGATKGEVVLGGRRVVVRKPRVRQDGSEVELPAWEEFADEDPMDERVLEQMLVGVSTRNYDRSVEQVPDSVVSNGASKSAASRRFVSITSKRLDEWLERDLSELRLTAIMLDGIRVGEHTVLVALGIDETAQKVPLGIWEGATENATVCQELLDNLIKRGVDPLRPYLFVIDGGKALRKAIRDTFGKRALVQRCQVHKQRNVVGHLPKQRHAAVAKAMRDAYRSKSKASAKKRLKQLAASLDDDYPDAAASLREGLDETLALKGLNLPESLERVLSTTNLIENLNGSIRRTTNRVRKWRSGKMIKRWIAAGLLEAQRGFRRLRGKKGISLLGAALSARCADKTIDTHEIAA
jgi:transposase-like protein